MISVYLFNHFLALFNHKDERQRTDGLQDLFFLLLKGVKLHPNQWEQLIPLLILNISIGKDSTLRRWAYQVGSFSINNNVLLVECCINSLSKEDDLRNQAWIIAILARNLCPKEFNRVVNRAEHQLTEENIYLCSYLFCSGGRINFKEVINRSNPMSLMWLAHIGAYKNIAIKYGKPCITPHKLSILTAETDNDEVLKHVMYAFFLQETFSMKQLYFNPISYETMGKQQKKCFFL